MTFKSTQNLLLELDGRLAGRFSGFSGGSMQGEVAEFKAGPNLSKHIVNMKVQDMVLTCGTGMSRGFYDWIGSSFGTSVLRKDGAVVQLSQSQVPAGRLEFKLALVTGLVMPALDRLGNSSAFMMVTISPELTRSAPVDASAKPGIYVSTLPKSWNISDFRLRIDGLESECRHVTKIDSLKLGQKAVLDNIGESRDAIRELSKPEYSNLNFRLPENNAGGFYDWVDDFLLKGNNGPQGERKGTLEFFAPHSEKPYFGIQFDGLGIVKAAGASALRGKTTLPVDISLYCETMKFSAGPAAVI